MIPFVESILSLLLGVALAVIGLIHSLSRYPGPGPFQQLAADASALGAVLLFAIGIVAALGGLAVLIFSIRRLRFRWRYLRQLTGRATPSAHRGYGDPHDPEFSGGYR